MNRNIVHSKIVDRNIISRNIVDSIGYIVTLRLSKYRTGT